VRYQDALSFFLGLPDEPTGQDWHDLAALVHRAGGGALLHALDGLPGEWAAEHEIDVHRRELVQLTGAGLRADAGDAADPEISELTVGDVPAMLDLTARTDPGPFRERTIELGGYLGIWRDGVLAAMAGERFSVPAGDGHGWTEVSAVCTDPAFRGQGLATRLVRAVAARVRARGDEIFLHVLGTNTGAIALYERIGFSTRTRGDVLGLSPLPHR
jgi:ribosomal protein S18 acetylase RimI-like enzyme